MAKIFNKAWLKESNLFSMLSIIVITCIITLFIVKYVFVWGYVPTESMYPTIEIGDKVGIYKIIDDIKYGDIIVFTAPEEIRDIADVTYLCKRVIATGGETIEIKLGKVYINDQLLDESAYAENTNDCTSMSKIIVPDDCVFVMGDNRENSYDSRYWENKFISLEDIEGVIPFKIRGLKIYSLV